MNRPRLHPPRCPTRLARKAPLNIRAHSAVHPSSLLPRPSRQRGVTLIEILAGLAVLGVLISSIMIARGRALRQWADADAKVQATRAVDTLLASWLADPTGPDRIPVPATGQLADLPDCTWRTTFFADPATRQLGVGVVRLEVFKDRRPLLSLDLLKRPEIIERTRRSP